MTTTESDPPEKWTTGNDTAQGQAKQKPQQHDSVDPTASVEPEHRMEEQRKPPPSTNNSIRHLEADTSSSKLTDMLNSATPRTESLGNFCVAYPSVMPSPPHKQHGPYVPIPPAPMLRGGPGPAGSWPSPRTNKTIEDHFFMTNEHLDVVGKTTYDALDMYTKKQISAANASHEQLVVVLNDHIKGLKAHLSSVNEKAESNSSQTHNVSLKLDQLESFLKDEVLTAMTGQAKKTAEMQSSLKEVQSTMTQMQQVMEKLSTTESGAYPPASSALSGSGGSAFMTQSTPNHQSQHALTTFYGNAPRRDEQSPMPPVQDRAVSNNYDSHSDPQGIYGTNWQSQAWNGRPSYHGRNKGEATSYAGANPYHVGNSNQYNNGYMSGYSSYSFSPSGSEQPHAYAQKPTQ